MRLPAFKSLFRQKVKVVPGGPANLTRGVGMLAALDALAEEVTLSPNSRPGLSKAYRLLTNAERIANGGFGEAFEDMDYLTCCISTVVTIETYQPDPLVDAVRNQKLVAVYDPAGRSVYVDGSFRENDLVPAKFVPAESLEAKYGYVRRDTSPGTINDWHVGELSIWNIGGADQFATAKQAGGPFPAFAGAEDAYWTPAAAPVVVPSGANLLETANTWKERQTFLKGLGLYNGYGFDEYAQLSLGQILLADKFLWRGNVQKMAQDVLVGWSPDEYAGQGNGPDLGLRRSSAGVLEVNTGAPGSPATVSAMEFVAQAAPPAYNSFTKLVNKLIAAEGKVAKKANLVSGNYLDPFQLPPAGFGLKQNGATGFYELDDHALEYYTPPTAGQRVNPATGKLITDTGYELTQTERVVPPGLSLVTPGQRYQSTVALFYAAWFNAFDQYLGPWSPSSTDASFFSTAPAQANYLKISLQTDKIAGPPTVRITPAGAAALEARVAALEALGGRLRGPWAASTAYLKFDMVVQAGGLYYANAAFTSGTTFDASKWTAIATGGAAYDDTNVVARLGTTTAQDPAAPLSAVKAVLSQSLTLAEAKAMVSAGTLIPGRTYIVDFGPDANNATQIVYASALQANLFNRYATVITGGTAITQVLANFRNGVLEPLASGAATLLTGTYAAPAAGPQTITASLLPGLDKATKVTAVRVRTMSVANEPEAPPLPTNTWSFDASSHVLTVLDKASIDQDDVLEVDWLTPSGLAAPGAGGGTTYTAGPGLELVGTEFRNKLTGPPALDTTSAYVRCGDFSNGVPVGSIPATQWSSVALTDVVNDPGHNFNPSTYLYTAPVSGKYIVVTKFRLPDAIGAGRNYAHGPAIMNADGEQMLWSETNNNQNGALNIWEIDLAAGQQVRLNVLLVNFSTGSLASMSIRLLRAA